MFGRDIGPCQNPAFAVIWIRPRWEKPVRSGAEGATAPETLRPKDQQGAGRTLERSVRARRRDNNLRQRDRGGSNLSAHDAGIVSRRENAPDLEAGLGRRFHLETHAFARAAPFARCTHGALRRLRHAGPIPGRRIEGAPAYPRRRRPLRRVPHGTDRRAAEIGKNRGRGAGAGKARAGGCSRPRGRPTALRPLHQCRRAAFSTT